MYLCTIRVRIAAHSGAQRVANRFRNNMSLTVFPGFSPIAQIQSMQCAGVGKRGNSHLHIIAKSIRNTLCAVSCRAVARLSTVVGKGGNK